MTKILPALLVCGFLGAGKTTFIMERLKSIRGRAAVLVNEFGALGVDGALVASAGGLEVVEIPGGCICCSQRENFVESIRRIAEGIRPDVLLIEPSGIAEASEVIRVLESEALSDAIRLDAAIAIVDASTFLDYSQPEAFGSFFLDQVTNANLIVVNKTDLVSPTELERAVQRILELNPAALTVEAAFCRVDIHLPSQKRKGALSPGRSALSMEFLSIAPELAITEELLSELAQELSSERFGKVFRGKGFLEARDGGLLNLQIVGNTLSATPFQGDVRPRLTLIGHDLERERVSQFFQAY